jgi:soluble lytic murein transglycosylase
LPRVPTYDQFQVTPNTFPQARFSAPDVPDIAGRQLQQLGGAAQQFGGEIGRIALDMAQQANQVRIDDALNQVKEEQLARIFHRIPLTASQTRGDVGHAG